MTYRVVVIALLVLGCGNKPSEHKQAVEQYVNVDMQVRWAELWTGKRPLQTLKPDVLDRDMHDWVSNAMTKYVVPRMTQFIDGASKVQPPAPMADLHALVIELATAYRDVGNEMLAAANAKDSAKFKAAHARMMETEERYLRWQQHFDTVLTKHGATFADVPPLPEPPTEAPPAKITYCGAQPCPCTAGSEVKTGDKLVSCSLGAATKIQDKDCAAGKVAFRDDGSLASCMFAGDDYFLAGEATFYPSGNIASMSSNLMLSPYPNIVCGAGPARKFDDGAYEACTVRGAATIAGIEIPKQATAFVVFYAGGSPRYLKYEAQERCIDPSGKPVEPCAMPTW